MNGRVEVTGDGASLPRDNIGFILPSLSPSESREWTLGCFTREGHVNLWLGWFFGVDSWLRFPGNGHGSKPMGSHFGIGAPISIYFSDWDVKTGDTFLGF